MNRARTADPVVRMDERTGERDETWAPAGAFRKERNGFPVVKLVRAFGGCLGTKRR